MSSARARKLVELAKHKNETTCDVNAQSVYQGNPNSNVLKFCNNKTDIRNVYFVEEGPKVVMENIPQIVPINPETNEISLPYELENETHSLDQTLKTLINIETNDIEVLSISKSQPLDEENLYPITINTMEVTIPFDEENLHTTSKELNSVDMVIHENDELKSSDTDDDQEYIPNKEEVSTNKSKTETSDSRKRITKNIIKQQNVNYDNKNSDENSDEENQEQNFTLKKKKKNRKAERKKLRNTGLQYINSSGNLISGKRLKANPCLNTKTCKNECNAFTEHDRQFLFNFFWKLGCSHKQKRFLSDCTSARPVKRRRKSAGVKDRKVTVEYFLLKDNVRRRVCKQFLLQTLSVTVRLLRTVLENKECSKFPEPDLRGKHAPRNKISDDLIAKFKDFINSLPVVPSHYCRGSSSRVYLPADVRSLNNLYRMYVFSQEQDNNTFLKKGKFLQLFRTLYNIGIHVPRKDKCQKCERYKNFPEAMKSETETTIYNKHIEEKDAIKHVFLKDQNDSREDKTYLVISFDLQKVLATPHGDNFLLFRTLYNIGIHVPRKDKCQKCERYKNFPEAMKSETETTIYNKHIKEKDAIKHVFLKDQNDSREDKTYLVISFDLQKVLATPHGDNFLLGFSRKYAVYNFSVYETTSRKGICYLWEEKDAKRGSNEICTNLLHYLKEVDLAKSYKKISMYCDNCSGQNKNKYIFAMLRYFLDNCKYVEEINLTYLITGHTYMPVDSIHAVIEKFVKHRIVEAPSEWPTLVRNARIHPEPYIVVKQKFSDFLDFKSLNPVKAVRLKMAQIRKVQFFKNDYNIRIQYSFLNPVESDVINFKLKPGFPKQAYQNELPISLLKYENLKSLCEKNTIKPQYHIEYLPLKHLGSVRDVLMETDVEDEEDQ